VNELNPDSPGLEMSCAGLPRQECLIQQSDAAIIEALRDCQAAVPDFNRDHRPSEATFDYALCLIDQGALVTMSWGQVYLLDGNCDSPNCYGFFGITDTPVGREAREVCLIEVPDYVES
jgi:hypothetical protein